MSKIFDNGEGKLILEEDIPFISGSTVIGDVLYSHGLVIFPSDEAAIFSFNNASESISWKSNQPIITTEYSCKVKDYEYTFTLNPSAADINGNLKNELTGSEFTPYVTSIGLYNDANELLAVAKLSRPVKKSLDLDMTFVVKLDS